MPVPATMDMAGPVSPFIEDMLPDPPIFDGYLTYCIVAIVKLP
jgi:hypothetical protein